MSGCFSSDCYQFQASRNEVVSTSGSSSSESEDNVTINGRGTVNNLNEDQLVRLEQLNAKEKERKEKNKTVARRLIVMASSENGVKEIWKVYEKQVVGGVEAFDSISEDVCDVFNMFIDTCLVHMVPRVTWNKNHMNETLTELFSIADEAFAMLVLENIAPDLQSDILRSAQGRLVWGDRKNAKPKFTKGGRDSQGKMRGWRYEGIVRYNELVMDVIGWRKKTESTRLSYPSSQHVSYRPCFYLVPSGLKGEIFSFLRLRPRSFRFHCRHPSAGFLHPLLCQLERHRA